MEFPLRRLDDLLRLRAESLGDVGIGHSIGSLTVCGAVYGAAMGSFGADQGPRLLQMLYSGIKVPLLLVGTFALSIPVYFVVSTLIGLREDFRLSVRALIAMQAVLAILLASFAPFTLLWYASSKDYSGALVFNALMFGLASVCAQRALTRLYRPLVERDARHRPMIRLWLATFAFVGIQMGWLLRPFVGNPDEPTAFFRKEAWGNAYEVLAHHVGRAIGL